MTQVHQNWHVSYFVCINNEAGKQGFQGNGWWGCNVFSYIAYLGLSICALPPFQFYAPFFLLLSYLVFLRCRGPVTPLPSSLPIFYIPYTWNLPLSISILLDTILGCHLCKPHTHGYFVHVMHIIFSLIPSDGELGVIFIPSEIHLEALNTFPWIFPSWPCAFILMPLSFHTTCFYFAFILVYLCIIIFVLFYLFWLFHIFTLNFYSALLLLMVASFRSVWYWFSMMFSLRQFYLYYG